MNKNIKTICLLLITISIIFTCLIHYQDIQLRRVYFEKQEQIRFEKERFNCIDECDLGFQYSRCIDDCVGWYEKQKSMIKIIL